MTDNNSIYCPYCMSKLSADGECPKCNLTEEDYCPAPHHLKPGTKLYDRYLVGRVLGEGGFGITYIGCDLKLDLKVAIKEYYPVNYCSRMAGTNNDVTVFIGSDKDFNHGMENFRSEAITMAKMDKQQEVVGVKEFFECNNTAYIIMEYVEGVTFKEIVERDGPFQPDDLFSIIEPLFFALMRFHSYGLIHRDISPNNLMLENGKVRLLDFGCARETGGDQKKKTMTVFATGGYTPLEQHQTKGKQGPWTDVYSLCATIYYCLTGNTPPSVFDRIDEDVLIPPRKLEVNITEQTEKALLEGLAVAIAQRPQSMEELYAALYETDLPGTIILESDSEKDSGNAENKNSGNTEIINSGNAEIKVWNSGNNQNPNEEKKIKESGKFVRTVLITGREPEKKSETALETASESVSKASETVAGKTNSAPIIPEYLKTMTERHPSKNEQLQEDLQINKEGAKKTTSKTKSKVPMIAGLSISGVVVIALLAFFIFTTSVPDITNMGLEEAKTQLKQASLKIEDIEYQDSESVAKDCIISCDPASKRVMRNSTVSLVVSKGCFHEIPDLVKKSQKEAEAILNEYNYVLDLTTKYSDNVDEGIVMKQEPASGTSLYEGEKVSLVVSAGPKPFALKKYVGESKKSAEQKLKKLGLKVKIRKSESKTKAIGTVLSQKPKASSMVRKGDTITLTVSKGAKVPDLTNMTKAKAKTALKKAGMKLGNITSDFSDSVKKGCVISQKTKAGKFIEPKSSVNIVISEGPGVTVPDVTGKSSSSAISVLKNRGLDYSISYDTTYDSDKDGIVKAQTEDAGDVVKQGSTIHLTVYQYVRQSYNSGSSGNSNNQSNNGSNNSSNNGSNNSSEKEENNDVFLED